MPRLWGIDSELDGFENSILLALPVIALEGRVAVARNDSWSLTPEHQLSWFNTESEALGHVTHLGLDSDLAVSPGELVVLIGPGFRDAWHVVGPLPDSPDKWVEVQGGFSLLCLPLERSQRLMKSLSERAKTAFDSEVRRAGADARAVTPMGQAALSMLQGNSEAPLEAVYARAIAAARIAEDFDSQTRLVFLAESELELTRDQVERLVEDYLAFAFGRWRDLVLAPASLIPAADHAHGMAGSSGAVAHTGNFDDGISDPAEMGRFLRLTIHGGAAALNGTTVAWAKAIGSALGHRVAEGLWSEADYQKMWRVFEEPIPDGLPPTVRRLYPEMIRAYAQSIAPKWHQAAEVAAYAGWRRPLRDRLAEVEHLRDKESVVLGVDQFGESRLLAALLLRAAADVSLRAAPLVVRSLSYGTGTVASPHESEAADISVRNRLTVVGKRERSEPLFYHHGYFVFAQSSHVESIAIDPDVPESVRRTAEALLARRDDPGSSVPTAISLSDRCWIACDAGMPQPPDREFGRLFDSVTACASESGTLRRTRVGVSQAHNEFDATFDQFVGGHTQVYMGGSIHSRLILRWLRRPLQLILLLCPQDFASLWKTKFPVPNILVFEKHFSQKLKEKKFRGLRNALYDSFAHGWEMLDALAQAPADDAGSETLLRGLMAALVQPVWGPPAVDTRWSFIAHTDDMRSLIKEDNSARSGDGRGHAVRASDNMKPASSPRRKVVAMSARRPGGR